jgi:pimeloyl-ACP methyl ester carboxylesterase
MTTRQQDTVRLPLAKAGALQVYVSSQDPQLDFAVVYVHGFGSTRLGVKSEALEAACVHRGWTYASFDFRGHGQSTGTMLELRGSLLLEDVEAVHQYLIGRGIRRLCPVGSSMGGWAAAWFTARHPQSATGCVLIAPALDFLHSRWAALSEAERHHWQHTGRHRVRNDFVDAEISYGLVEERPLFPPEQLPVELRQPGLIFHGMKDDVVPWRGSLTFVEQALHADLELRLYKNGDHRLLAYSAEMAESACAFFAAVSK